MAVWLDGWMVEWLDGWMAGWLDGWMVGWLDGWMVGWLGGWVAGCALIPAVPDLRRPSRRPYDSPMTRAATRPMTHPGDHLEHEEEFDRMVLNEKNFLVQRLRNPFYFGGWTTPLRPLPSTNAFAALFWGFFWLCCYVIGGLPRRMHHATRLRSC